MTPTQALFATIAFIILLAALIRALLRRDDTAPDDPLRQVEESERPAPTGLVCDERCCRGRKHGGAE